MIAHPALVTGLRQSRGYLPWLRLARFRRDSRDRAFAPAGWRAAGLQASPLPQVDREALHNRGASPTHTGWPGRCVAVSIAPHVGSRRTAGPQNIAPSHRPAKTPDSHEHCPSHGLTRGIAGLRTSPLAQAGSCHMATGIIALLTPQPRCQRLRPTPRAQTIACPARTQGISRWARAASPRKATAADRRRPPRQPSASARRQQGGPVQPPPTADRLARSPHFTCFIRHLRSGTIETRNR